MPDKERMRLGAIILAGGRSARMGRPKEALPFAGAPLLTRIATALAPACEPVVVVARDARQPLPPLPAAVLRTHDDAPGRGPLAGVAAGLRRLAAHGFASVDAAFVVACDHPFVDAAFARGLAERLGDAEAAMPDVDGRVEPLCAVYRLRCLPRIDALLAAGDAGPSALADAAARVPAAALRVFDPELRALCDVDTAADYEAARRQEQA
ncbi:MAG: molybdenum cofactor guanylyltransferase [Planctomycetes bacterium]|nr:molybdenum cofactor guanylyltransferase [Planctomycetota bacterium]